MGMQPRLLIVGDNFEIVDIFAGVQGKVERLLAGPG
jgi:hypothetical protein